MQINFPRSQFAGIVALKAAGDVQSLPTGAKVAETALFK